MAEMVNGTRLAEMAGVTISAITKARQNGRITGIKKGREWFYDTIEAERLGENAKPESLGDRAYLAKTRKLEAEAELAELQLAKAKGILIEALDAENDARTAAMNARTKLLSIPSRVAAELSGLEPAQIQARLTQVIRECLSELGTSLVEEATDG
jgi:phage terminase Nu1 subunit (DNA packaging protein)